MILVNKTGAAPTALRPGLQETTDNCTAYDGNVADYRSGAKKFNLKRQIYGAPAVKAALKRLQHFKCCYCESRFDANYQGDVEHFRPKGAITVGKHKIYPGYYWLAYAWSNLYYACADCNQYRKRALFPLRNETNRALDHHHSVRGEDPLLLDPGGPRNPRDHIMFKHDVPVWTSEYGKATIKALKLDRDELNLARRTHFEALNTLRAIVRLLQDDTRPEAIAEVARARRLLTVAVRPKAVFSAASKDYLQTQDDEGGQIKIIERKLLSIRK